MLLPAPLHDEIFGSLLARMGRMNGYADFRDMASQYCGDGPISSFIDAEIDLSRFSRQTNFAYPGAEELLQNLTWYGAQVKLGEMAWLRIDGLAKGNDRLTLSSSMFPDSAVLGYCPTCRDHDLRQYGMSYWHRLHQLPIVFFCPHHGDGVVKMRIKRFTLHKEFPVPGDFESDLSSSEPMFGMNENFWRGVEVDQDEDHGRADPAEPEMVDALLDAQREPADQAELAEKGRHHDQGAEPDQRVPGTLGLEDAPATSLARRWEVDCAPLQAARKAHQAEEIAPSGKITFRSPLQSDRSPHAFYRSLDIPERAFADS